MSPQNNDGKDDQDHPNNNENDRHIEPGKTGHVSTRGASNLALPTPYMADFKACFANLCTDNNRQGYIQLCVAENKLMNNVWQDYLASNPHIAVSAFQDDQVYGYNAPEGLWDFRQTIAEFVQERFFASDKQDDNIQTASTTSNSNSNNLIDPNHIVVGAGAIALLHNLAFALGNHGDAVLIPAPYYAAFDNDLRTYAGCHPIPVPCQDPIQGPTVQELESTKLQAEQEGRRVKFLLLTNPHNPLGVIYDAATMKQWIDWARTHGLETIVDEIYALSVFGEDNDTQQQPKFQSILQILDNDLGHDVHWLWGFSKDFAASGFRMGILYSQNPLLLEVMSNLITFSWVSHPMQIIMKNVLKDAQFVNQFLATSRQRLKANYEICIQVLTECGIPFVKAQGGMFVYLDVSSLANIQTFEEEAQFAKLLFQRARLVLTPGKTQHDPQPGRFRLCYAYVSPYVLQLAMERLKRVMEVIRTQEQGQLGDWMDEDRHWNDIIS